MEWFQVVMNPLVDIQGNLFPIFGIFASSAGALIAIARIGQDDDTVLRMMMMIMKHNLTFVFVFGFPNDDDGGIEMKLMMAKMSSI